MKAVNPARELAKFALETRWEDLPPDIVHETKRVLMDSIGCILGALTMEKGKKYVALARRYGGPPESSIMGLSDKVSLPTAALANGELMFTLDYHTIMSGAHDAPYVLPTILAVAESTGASGKDLILSATLGCEISSRLARAVLRHPIGVQAGTPRPAGPQRNGNAYSNFGAAAGAGKLLKFDQEKMVHALGLAGHLCMALTYGRWGHSETRYMGKYGIPGWQNTGAVMAVLLAEMGYTGDTTVLDTENGFAFFTGYRDWYPEKILEDIGKTWWYNYRLHYKPYPCCAVFHSELDCFMDVLEKYNLLPEEIESVRAYGRASTEGGLFAAGAPENISSAQFNPRYIFSVAAHRVRVGPEWHDPETAHDPRILAFMPKVTCQPHPDYQKQLAKEPLSSIARCDVTARGKVYTIERKHRRGTTGTDAALTDDDLIRKFRHNAERVLTQDKIDRAVQAFMELEKLDNTTQLIREVTL